MRKSLLSLLVLFVYSLVAFAQEGTEITWEGQSDWTGVGTQEISFTQGNWSIQASKQTGSTNPTVNAKALDFRAYAKNIVMVGNSTENIGKLVFHISAQGKTRWTDVNPSQGVITEDFENSMIIWEANGEDVQSVSFTVGDYATLGTDGTTKAGQFDFTSVTAYTKAELTVTEPEPEPEPVPSFVLYHAGYNGNDGFIGFASAEEGAEGILVTKANLAATDNKLLTWQLIETETEGQYKIKNGAGYFLGVAGYNQTPTAVTEENAPVYTKADYNGYITFNCPSGSYAPDYSWLHVAKNNKLTGWTQDATASSFTVKEVAAVDSVKNLLAKAVELDAALAAAQTMKQNITGYTEYTDLITSADQFDSNAKETTPGEGTYEALLDGDPTTFFHSQWQTGWQDKMPHNLQVKLPGNELTELVVRYAARNNRGNYFNIPTAMNIYGGTVDAEGNVTWEETAFTSLTAEEGSHTRTDVEGIGGRSGRFTINTGETVYTAFKFEVTDTYYDGRTEKFFSYGEFQISAAREVAPTVEASENQVLALDNAIAKAQAAVMGESDYDALIAGINTAMANIENGVEPEPDPELQAALNAAVADAQEAIAIRGAGYPVEEGTSYTALNEAIATAQAVTYPTAAAVEALTTATHAYKCATDVEMPTVGHRYAFAITYQGETKYYLQNADSVNVLKAYVAEEELGDTLIFKCVEENEGKFTFTNSDGKYVTLTQPAKSWYSPNNTGVSEEKNVNTDVTFAKLSNGGKVAAADEAELFGCLSWYGVRGYNTSNSANDYGYLVVKHSADAFDGAAAPYYDANFTSAIKLVDLGPEPPLEVTVTPADGSIVEEFTSFELTFSETVSYNEEVVPTFNNRMAGISVTPTVAVNAEDATKVTLTLAEPIAEVGNYTLVVPAGAFNSTVSDKTNADLVYSYRIMAPANSFVFATAEPADSATVESLSDIVITYPEEVGYIAASAMAFDGSLVVKNAAEEVVSNAILDYDEDWSTIHIRLQNEITEPGAYSITVPEQLVWNMQFSDMEEDLGVANGAIYNPEFTLTYFIEEAAEEDTVATFMYETVSPENGSTVNRLDVITLHFPDNIPAMSYDELINVYNEAGDSITTAELYWANYPNGDVTLTLAKPITTAGTYTITVDEGMIWNSKLDFDADDYGVSTGAKYNPTFTLTYTVEEVELEDYYINFDKDAYQTHSERILNSISLTAGDGVQQTATLDGTKKAYQDLTSQTFTIVSGDEVTVTANYSGSWMHTYVYVDLDNDKQFSFNEGGDQTGTELLGWTYIAGYNNEGASVGRNVDPQSPMKFTVNAEPGEYRMRVKVDWDNQDPGGCVLSNNHILNNGGHIVDVTLVVTENTGINAVTIDQNAEVYTLDGRRVSVNGKLNRGIYIINGQKTFVK
ncbi:MAG: hypothetical protein PUD40_05550 [Bacteroidales bacterium]|nr:hypothetical protein [Bacteroidales bacterium]